MQRDTWKRVHAELTRLARSKGAYDEEEARWLLEGKRVRVHEPLGYGTFLSYLEHVFGYGPRLASERLRVAEAIAELPAMTTALAEGELCWSAVRELTRVAVPETEGDWIAAARGKSMREVEDLVSGRKSGDRPGDPADPAMKRAVLRLEVTGDGLAAFREARRRIELDVGHSLDDDAFVRMLAHHALGGPTDPGRAAYQVAMTVCPQCRRGTRDGAGRELAVEPHVVDAALCDAQHIGDTHVDGVPVKASQTIPPRIRRLVVRRAHGRCEVPGCRAARYLEIHHLIHRAHGGTHDPSLLILVCSAHHAAIHRGALQVSGTAPDRLEFRRRGATWPVPSVRGPSDSPPPTPGAPAPPDAPGAADAAVDTRADVIVALRRLGFSASEARRAVDATSSAAGDIETVLRAALSHLRPPVKVSCASEPRARYGSQHAPGSVPVSRASGSRARYGSQHAPGSVPVSRASESRARYGLQHLGPPSTPHVGRGRSRVDPARLTRHAGSLAAPAPTSSAPCSVLAAQSVRSRRALRQPCPDLDLPITRDA